MLAESMRGLIRGTYLRHTGHRTSGELVNEGEGLLLLLLRHDGIEAGN